MSKDIIIPEWLSEKKDGLGPRVEDWHQVRETKKAVMVKVQGRDEPVWLPKSQITYEER